jgi:Mlc titration factor MtfA (ptsG expression regulator)
MFGFKRRRRRRILAQPFPTGWLSHLQRNVHHYASLDEAERAKLRDDLRIFIAEKRWEGCGGLIVTDEIQVTIAALACLLVLKLPVDRCRRVKDILIYPAAYFMPHPQSAGGGIMREGIAASGTAWYRGPVILSWADALAGARNASDGRNVVLHEFAHRLDMLDGLVDGTPPLRSRRQYLRWHRVMTDAFEELRRDSEEGRATLLRAYGATNPGEFFAVATECFFERPGAMRREHADLYDVLREYYGQDPAERLELDRAH